MLWCITVLSVFALFLFKDKTWAAYRTGQRRGGAGRLTQRGAGPHRESFWTRLQINPLFYRQRISAGLMKCEGIKDKSHEGFSEGWGQAYQNVEATWTECVALKDVDWRLSLWSPVGSCFARGKEEGREEWIFLCAASVSPCNKESWSLARLLKYDQFCDV